MTELHIPTLRRIAEKQLQEAGQIDNEILDIIIEDWQIDLAAFKDPKKAKELWRNLITLFLIDTEGYNEVCELIKYKVQKCRGKRKFDIPDIVA